MPIWRVRKTEQTPNDPPAAGGRSSAPAEVLELRLLAGVRAGVRADFESLYRIYHPRLLRFLGQMIQRPELVDEVLDDTLMVVWQRADAFAGQSKLSTWIFGIAYRKALKALDRQDLPLPDPEPDLQIDPGPSPEQQLGAAQVQARLRRALAELSADHRAVLELCYFHDMAYGEIAEVVNCPAETVKTRVFYARRRLKTLLADLADRTQGERW